MQTDEFTQHLARVRARFAAALDSKIADSFAAVEAISRDDGSAIDVVIVAHRRLHEMCGIAPTLGFSATGQAARGAEAVVRAAARDKRILKADELAALRSALERLRDAARDELQAFAGEQVVEPAPP